MFNIAHYCVGCKNTQTIKDIIQEEEENNFCSMYLIIMKKYHPVSSDGDGT
jgi:hypothetical protein